MLIMVWSLVRDSASSVMAWWRRPWNLRPRSPASDPESNVIWVDRADSFQTILENTVALLDCQEDILRYVRSRMDKRVSDFSSFIEILMGEFRPSPKRQDKLDLIPKSMRRDFV